MMLRLKKKKAVRSIIERELADQKTDEATYPTREFDLQKQLFPHMTSGYFFVLNTDVSYDLQHIQAES